MSRIPCAKALVLVVGATVVAALAVARTAAVLPTFAPAWVGSSTVASGFGRSVSFAGDVNGDGYDDVVVGAPWFANGQSFEGKAFAYHGSAAGLSPTPNWSIENNVAFATLGSAVAGVGDVNGDGYDDVVVGAEQYSNGQQFEGRAQMFLGSATGLSVAASWTVESNDGGSHFGYDVSAAGDVNNDGFCDVLVGAPESNAGGTAYVYHGSPAGLPVVASAIRTGPHFDAAFAFESKCAGDVNGDGFDDVVVGVPGFTNGQQSEGGAFVYAGSATGLGAAPMWTTESNLAGIWHGLSVGDGGDFNADGYSDFAVGTWLYEADKWKEGRVEVYGGASTGPGAVPTWTQVGGQVGASFGSAIANAGDVNADGIDDLLVGSSEYDDVPTSFVQGRMFVYLGSPNGLEPTATWAGGNTGTAMFLGMSVDGDADVNGDGFCDVIGGGENFDNGSQHAEVHHGGPFAAVAPYGVAKSVNPLTTAAPRLTTTVAPTIGGTSNLNISGGVKLGGGGILFAGFQAVSVPFDLGTLNVLPTYVVYLPTFDAQGKASLQVPIPPIAGLQDLSVYFQAMQSNFQAPGFYHLTMTNGLRWVIGT